MDDTQRINADAATTYAAVYWLGLLVCAAVEHNHAAVVLSLIGVALGFLANASANVMGTDKPIPNIISLACNVVSLVATCALILGFAH